MFYILWVWQQQLFGGHFVHMYIMDCMYTCSDMAHVWGIWPLGVWLGPCCIVSMCLAYFGVAAAVVVWGLVVHMYTMDCIPAPIWHILSIWLLGIWLGPCCIVSMCRILCFFVEYGSCSRSMWPVWSGWLPGWVSCYFAHYYITLNGPPQFSMMKEVWNTAQVPKKKR